MMLVSSHRCIYRVELEKVIWMPSSGMKIMLGLHRWCQMASCTKQANMTWWNAWSHWYHNWNLFQMLMSKLLCAYAWSKEVRNFCQNIPTLFTIGVLALYRTHTTRHWLCRCVWDVYRYRKDGLKSQTQQSHGSDNLLRVATSPIFQLSRRTSFAVMQTKTACSYF